MTVENVDVIQPVPAGNPQPLPDSPQTTLTKILSKIDAYLGLLIGEAKKANATDARIAIQAILDNPTHFTDNSGLWQVLTASALTAWTDKNKSLVSQRWTNEWSGGRTTQTITACETLLTPHLSHLIDENAPEVAPAAVAPSFQLRNDMPIREQLVPLIRANHIESFTSALIQAIAYSTNESPFDINATDDQGKTLLHIAATHTSGAFIAALLEQGANPNLADKNGWSPVQYSAYTGKLSHFEAYKTAGNVIQVNWDQKTPEGKDLIALTTTGKEKLENDPAFSSSDHDAVIEKLRPAQPLILSGGPNQSIGKYALTLSGDQNPQPAKKKGISKKK